MTRTIRCHAAIAILLLAASPAHAGSCARTIASAQTELDSAIENRSGSNGWKPESFNALRGHQPTPRSLAATEGVNGARFEVALDSLDRARAADRSGHMDVCRYEVDNAQSVLDK